MPLADQPLPMGKAGVSRIEMTNSDGLPLSPQSAAFDEPIFDRFDEMDSQDSMAPSPKRVRAHDHVPALPPRSALRASGMVDKHELKLGGAMEGAHQVTTPHDVYLSSEEDASSDADDFSDYDYDSSVEDPTSPTRRGSPEVTARVVSVVFAGKPLIVDLPTAKKRPTSSSSLGTTRTRSSTDSSARAPTATTTTTAAATASEDRPATPASTTSSHSQTRPSKDSTPNRRSSLLSELLIKKKPPFLSIDPYANGSSYTLDIPKALDSLEGEQPSARTPRTPTALLKGVTRSLSLVRKRSRPNLSSPQTAVPILDTSVASNPNKPSIVQSPATAMHADVAQQHQHQQQGQEQEQQQQQQRSQEELQSRREQPTAKPEQQPTTPLTPVTYNDILRSVKRNATVMAAPSPTSDAMSPTSPAAAPAGKRGILSGLAARRRSVKLLGKV